MWVGRPSAQSLQHWLCGANPLPQSPEQGRCSDLRGAGVGMGILDLPCSPWAALLCLRLF